MINKISLPDGYQVVWSDEFDNNNLDDSIWSAEERQSGWIDGECQEYCGENCISFKDGFLSIKPKLTTNSSGEPRYLSGRISTFGKKDFTYGRIVARIKVPKAKGLVSYIRLMPTEGYDEETENYKEFPLHGQIDLAEINGGRPDEAVSRVVFGYP